MNPAHVTRLTAPATARLLRVRNPNTRSSRSAHRSTPAPHIAGTATKTAVTSIPAVGPIEDSAIPIWTSALTAVPRTNVAAPINP